MGQRAGIDEDAGRAGSLFLQEVDDLAFVVALQETYLQAQRGCLLAHRLIQILERSGAVNVRLALAEQIQVWSVDHDHALHASDLVTTRRIVAPGTIWPIAARPMRRGITHATCPRRAS